MGKSRALGFAFMFLGLVACGQGPAFELKDMPSENQGLGQIDDPATPNPTPAPTPTPPPTNNSIPLDDSKITLDSFGETFQATNATRLLNSRYMERNCQNVTDWGEWKNLPMKRCRYQTDGQSVEVLMLNPGPRRLTLWLEEACGSLAGNFSSCMTSTFNQIVSQSGGQFPVAGVVIEDMDGNGLGNAYAFRNGVTVQVGSFGNATESILTATQVANSFTDAVIKTYTYARPVSVTREQLTAYAGSVRLSIPALGTSSARGNAFNDVVGDLYREAWTSSQNHLIRAWVYDQNF